VFVAPPPHLLVPFQLDATGAAATVDQGSLREIAQCVRVLLSTPVGSRIEQFDYGMPDLTFSDERGAKLAISLALRNWEPRAVGAQLAVQVNTDGTATVVAQLPPTAGGTR
jgi:phage baseplate assembly protein W